MKHLEITHQPEMVREFVLAIGAQADELIFENNGIPFARMTPISMTEVDKNLLTQAILARREESRRGNAEWEPLDLECWGRI